MAWPVHVSSNIKALDVYMKGGGDIFPSPVHRLLVYRWYRCGYHTSPDPLTSDLNLLLYIEGTGYLLGWVIVG
jgi:hypothetical protein